MSEGGRGGCINPLDRSKFAVTSVRLKVSCLDEGTGGVYQSHPLAQNDAVALVRHKSFCLEAGGKGGKSTRRLAQNIAENVVRLKVPVSGVWLRRRRISTPPACSKCCGLSAAKTLVSRWVSGGRLGERLCKPRGIHNHRRKPIRMRVHRTTSWKSVGSAAHTDEQHAKQPRPLAQNIAVARVRLIVRV